MTTTTTLARCTQRSCAVRWRTGRDRACADHGDQNADDTKWLAYMEAPRQPGEHGDGQQDGSHATGTT